MRHDSHWSFALGRRRALPHVGLRPAVRHSPARIPAAVQWELALRWAARAGMSVRTVGPCGSHVRARVPPAAVCSGDGACHPFAARGVRRENPLIHRPSLRRRSRHAAARAALVSFLALTLPPLAAAQSSPSGDVVVTATRTPVAVADALAEVTVLDRADLARFEGATLAQVLAAQPGLQLSSNGGLGKPASLFIRGLEARHTLLLVDGARLGSATVGSPSLDNLPLAAIERIEIVRGPLSSLYGSGAMGGVVQVFTRRGTQGLQGHAQAAVGSERYGQAAAGVAFGGGGFDAAVQVQHTETRGASSTTPAVPFGNHDPDRDGFRQTGGSVRLGWQPAGAGATASGWRVEAVLLGADGVTGVDDGPRPGAQAGLETRAAVLSARGPVVGPWSTRLSVGETRDRYETLATASAFTPLGVIGTTSRQLGWENTVATPLGTALALLERTQEEVSRPGQPFSVSERDIDALALGLAGRGAGQHWQASVRRDRNSQFGGITTGAAAWAWDVTSAWRVGASLGTSQTLPSFNQLYFPNFGNPLLQPEKGRHAELHLRLAQGAHQWRAALYGHRYRSFIPSGPLPANLPRAEIDGATLSYEGRLEGPWGALALAASLDHVDPRNATVGNANFDKLLPRRARESLRLAADWDGGAWSAGASVQAHSHRFDNAANTVRLGGYATLDLRARWRVQPGTTLGLRVENAGDKAYETALGYAQPRRRGFVTLQTEWR
jgi:vitamin B12 transporter